MNFFPVTPAVSRTSARNAAGRRSRAPTLRPNGLRAARCSWAIPRKVAEKTLEHSEALGGIARISFQMDVAALPHAKLMHAIELLGTRVAPVLHAESVLAA